jgi:hypothetical protein
MARQTYTDADIKDGADSVPYKDHREMVNGTLKHMAEMFMQKVTGAGGAGGAVTSIPFEPAIVEVWGVDSLSLFKSYFASDTAVHFSLIDTGAGATDLAANATPPVVSQDGDQDWDIDLPTEMAPDSEEVVVVVWGFRDVNGSL